MWEGIWFLFTIYSNVK